MHQTLFFRGHMFGVYATGGPETRRDPPPVNIQGSRTAKGQPSWSQRHRRVFDSPGLIIPGIRWCRWDETTGARRRGRAGVGAPHAEH